MPTVLITGVSGYLGSWCTQVALEAGHDVVGTVRDPTSAKCKFLRDAMEGNSCKISKKATEHLTLVKADLLSGDEAWDSVFSGRSIDYVMHTASPYFGKAPEDENDYIRPAVEGTKSVLKAAIKHGVKRVVCTSTVGTMWFPLIHGKTYSEQDWSTIEGNSAYGKSKTLAEQAAWELVKGSSVELVTVLPMFILGPTLYSDSDMTVFESGDLVTKIMTRKLPMLPNMKTGISDVRDVARAHLLSLDNPDISGHRVICSGATQSMVDIAGLFAKAKPELQISTKTMPSILVRIASLCSPAMKVARSRINIDYNVDTSVLQQILSLSLTPESETVRDMVEDFINVGAVQLPTALKQGMLVTETAQKKLLAEVH